MMRLIHSPRPVGLVAERAYLFRMRDEAYYSRSNAPEELIRSAEGRSEVQTCIERFAKSHHIRLFLVLELAGGQALAMYNSLRPEVPANGEPGAGSDLWDRIGDAWELKIELWPLGVCQSCHCQQVEAEADNSPKLCRECSQKELDSRR